MLTMEQIETFNCVMRNKNPNVKVLTTYDPRRSIVWAKIKTKTECFKLPYTENEVKWLTLFLDDNSICQSAYLEKFFDIVRDSGRI